MEERNGHLDPTGYPGTFRTLLKVITSPGEAFTAAAAAPRLLGSIVLILAVNLAVTLVILPKTREFARITLENMPGLTAEQIEMSLSAVGITAVAAALAIPLLIWLLEAAYLKLFDQFAVSGTSFKALFTVAVLAWVPALLGNLVKTVLMLMVEAKDVELIQTSLAVILPPEQAAGVLYAVLSKIDPFIIWNLVLLAIGTAVVTKIETRRTALWVIGLYLIYLAVSAGLAAISVRMAGF